MVEQVSDEDRAGVRATYLKKYPDAFWVDFGDFRLVRVIPRKVRFFAGAGSRINPGGMVLNSRHCISPGVSFVVKKLFKTQFLSLLCMLKSSNRTLWDPSSSLSLHMELR
jgi:hypothetical protein